MTNLFLHILCASAFLSFGSVFAKPMDSVAAKELPEMKRVVEMVKARNALSETDASFLRRCLKTNDPVLVALSAWCITRMTPKLHDLSGELNRFNPEIGDVAYAFVALAKEADISSALPVAQQLSRLRALANSENAFLKVEAAKAISRLDNAEGLKLLAEMAKEPSGTSAVEAARTLSRSERRERMSSSKVLPATNEQYETILGIIGEMPQ